MFADKIPSNTLKLLGLLKTVTPTNSYLAGGTALALHLNHRSSYDLDIYSPESFEESRVSRQWQQAFPEFKLTLLDWQTVQGVVSDTDISLFLYEYPALEKPQVFNGFPIASIADIAAMKIEAIMGRGLKRDFFDLYCICTMTELSLNELLSLNQTKYTRDGSNLPHILKSLTYFEDANTKSERATEVEPIWNKVQQFFIQEVPSLIKSYNI